jgi:hypothetical protein
MLNKRKKINITFFDLFQACIKYFSSSLSMKQNDIMVLLNYLKFLEGKDRNIQ